MRKNKKNAYVEAEIELIRFESCDVITTSGGYNDSLDNDQIDSGSNWDS